MDNFEYVNPTNVVFGKNAELKTGELLKEDGAQKVLFHFGGGSIKKTGLYERIVGSLKNSGIDFIELGGVEPNPRVSLIRRGIDLCKTEGADYILAVGGGSVIDSAKAISIGAGYAGDVWDFFLFKAKPQTAVPIGVVLTIAAAGSETSSSCVITNEVDLPGEGMRKYSVGTNLFRPRFAIMNPELTYTLPPYQTACGVVDMMAHVIERYITNTEHTDLTDRLCEATMTTIKKFGPIALRKPEDYNARAELMLAGSLAHNGLLGVGRVNDFGSHGIEHELSAKYDIAHGAGLAVVMPAWMKYVYKRNIRRFAQFACRVWEVDNDFMDTEQTALEGISRAEAFFKSLGMPVRLSDAGMRGDDIAELSKKCFSRVDSLGKFVTLKEADVAHILHLANS
ncbi:MAG: iron-containing alcohol dehydrogenase [Oscillospiraceae bacterium]|nr:iron-containing alcohol dehydrogenase [Oscillospiraceae bacterium]